MWKYHHILASVFIHIFYSLILVVSRASVPQPPATGNISLFGSTVLTISDDRWCTPSLCTWLIFLNRKMEARSLLLLYYRKSRSDWPLFWHMHQYDVPSIHTVWWWQWSQLWLEANERMHVQPCGNQIPRLTHKQRGNKFLRNPKILNKEWKTYIKLIKKITIDSPMQGIPDPKAVSVWQWLCETF